MYYSVTDFPTREYVEMVLESQNSQSIKAVKLRIKNKKDWEGKQTAPYSELYDLLEELKK